MKGNSLAFELLCKFTEFPVAAEKLKWTFHVTCDPLVHQFSRSSILRIPSLISAPLTSSPPFFVRNPLLHR